MSVCGPLSLLFACWDPYIAMRNGLGIHFLFQFGHHCLLGNFILLLIKGWLLFGGREDVIRSGLFLSFGDFVSLITAKRNIPRATTVATQR